VTQAFSLGLFTDGIVKDTEAVTPAKAGVYDPTEITGSPPAQDDQRFTSATFYELIFSCAGKIMNNAL
jgi:hypothetical protein